jgi:hypothetical protein
VDKLRQFDHRQDWYLGKVSLSEPLEIFDRDSSSSQNGIQVFIALFYLMVGASFGGKNLNGSGQVQKVMQ